jgi:hypothetical protein
METVEPIALQPIAALTHRDGDLFPPSIIAAANGGTASPQTKELIFPRAGGGAPAASSNSPTYVHAGGGAANERQSGSRPNRYPPRPACPVFPLPRISKASPRAFGVRSAADAGSMQKLPGSLGQVRPNAAPRPMALLRCARLIPLVVVFVREDLVPVAGVLSPQDHVNIGADLLR